MTEKGFVRAGEQLKAKNRLTILEAAVKVFSEKGFAGGTTKEIAQEAGVAEGTIYRYFRSKKDLLWSLAGPVLVESLADILQENEIKEERELLEAVLENRIGLIRKNLPLFRILLNGHSDEQRELAVKVSEEVMLRGRKMLESTFARRIKRGQFREMDPEIAVQAFLGMFAGYIVFNYFLNFKQKQPLDDAKAAETLVDIFLNGTRIPFRERS